MEAILKREVVLNKTACRLIGVCVFVILTALGAFVRIPLPFTPVPITLQTFFVLLSGALLGKSLGAITQLSYIFLGISGLPVFSAAGSGLTYLAGPTGGYIFGFVAASFFLGKTLKSRQKNLLSIFALFCLADFLLLGCGVFWLKALFGYSLKKLFLIGFLPFIVGDLLKAYLATLIYLSSKSRLEAIFPQ